MKKAVVLAGGKGTRLLPSTSVTNKHLLPVYSHQGSIPMILYPINTLIESGITDILIVSSQEHVGLLTEFLGDGYKFNSNFTYRIQDHSNPKIPMGIASALKQAEDFTDNEKFAVILGDNFYNKSFKNDFESFENSDKLAHVFLKSVSDPDRFGVATINEQNEVVKIVEKPKNPETNLAVTGLYLYTPHVYNVAKNLKPSNRNELEITDINNYYVKSNLLSATNIDYVDGWWSDMGVPESMLNTIKFIDQTGFRIQHA
jgi:glucose-1-phosphate thymidylyltransferase